MTTVAVHYPVKVLSISPTALDRSEGISHLVKTVHGPAMHREVGARNSWEADPDALNVQTICGKRISVHPETQQVHRRPCVRCLRPADDPAPLIRIIPPVDESHGRWAQYYWASGNGGLFA